MAGPIRDQSEVIRHPPDIREGVLPVAAIYGANASGKTNVIRALLFVAHAVGVSHRTWTPDGPIPRDPFISDEISGSAPSEFVVDFLVDRIRHQYGFVIDSEKILREWLFVFPRGKKQTWFEREQNKAIAFGSKMPGENRTIENLTRRNSLFLSAAAQNNHELLLPVYRWITDLLFVIGSRGMYQDHTATLCSDSDFRETVMQMISAADLGITAMEFKEVKLPEEAKKVQEMLMSSLKLDSPFLPEMQATVRFFHQLGDDVKPFDLTQESDGTRAYFAVLGPVVRALKNGRFLCIDELDASLHPLLAVQLIRLFNSPSTNPKGAQLVFNTHDTNLLSNAGLRRDQVWFCEKNKDATTHLYPLSDFKPRRQENLQNGYLQGRYGAIPFINPDSFLTDFEVSDGKT